MGVQGNRDRNQPCRGIEENVLNYIEVKVGDGDGEENAWECCISTPTVRCDVDLDPVAVLDVPVQHAI